METKIKILLADESTTMHRAFKLALIKENYELHVIDNGADAWKICQEKKPDILLADLDLPELTGSELIHRIKSDAVLSKQTLCVLLCASYNQKDDTFLKKIPADAKLWKPYESIVLKTLLKTLLKDKLGSMASLAGSEKTQHPNEDSQQRVFERTQNIVLPSQSPASEQTATMTVASDELDSSDKKTQAIDRSSILRESRLEEKTILPSNPSLGLTAQEPQKTREVIREPLPPGGLPLSEKPQAQTLTGLTNNIYSKEVTRGVEIEAKDVLHNIWDDDFDTAVQGAKDELPSVESSQSKTQALNDPNLNNKFAHYTQKNKEKALEDELNAQVRELTSDLSDEMNEGARDFEALPSSDAEEMSLPAEKIQIKESETSSLDRQSDLSVYHEIKSESLSQEAIKDLVRSEISLHLNSWFKEKLENKLTEIVKKIEETEE